MLIATKETLLQYAELTAAINFASVSRTIRDVERDAVLPVIGQALYDEINVENESGLSAPLKKLLDACRSVIGPLVVYHYTPKAEVKIGDAGAQRMETANAKTAYQNQIVNFREQNLRDAEASLEALYKLLDENPTDYADWDGTDGKNDFNQFFIRTGTDFAKLFPSASPYRNYYAIRPIMDDVQQMSVLPILGDALFAYLLNKEVTSETLSAAEFQLIRRIKKLIAYRTMADAVPLLNVRVDANGITVMSQNRALNDALNTRQAADAASLNGLIKTCELNADKYRCEVVSYLTANAASFPLYTPPTTTTTTTQYKGLFTL